VNDQMLSYANVMGSHIPLTERHGKVGHYPRTCSICGKAFAAARPQTLYCSPRCRQTVLLRRRHEVGRRNRHRRCPRCGQVFVARRSDGVFCSSACRQAMHRRRHHGEGRDDADTLSVTGPPVACT
jgi:predicted nucleic acid-binding Zn ribbon protein